MWNLRYLEELICRANKSSTPILTNTFVVWWLTMKAWIVWYISHLGYFPLVLDLKVLHSVNGLDGCMYFVVAF